MSFTLPIPCHKSNVRLPINGIPMQIRAVSLVELPAISRARTVFADPYRELVYELLKPSEKSSLFGG